MPRQDSDAGTSISAVSARCPPAHDGARPVSLRTRMGTLLGDTTRAATHAVALPQLASTNTHLPVDGYHHGGRPRRPLHRLPQGTATEHFPRTDTAGEKIMLVPPDDRCC